ncbi:MAG: MYXO-CTERM sorting domain-containing protein [Myxococcales bacterium]|nr:MYXO-CTERM sorting domain-containing protein [Myxococcales bacterium]
MLPRPRVWIPCTLVALATLGWSTSAEAAVVPVTTTAELQAAVANAMPGDEIVLAPGTYILDNKLNCTANGTADQPIVIRADTLGDATVQMNNLEGFHIQGAHWEIANLDIEGVCADDNNCEHAFHVTGDAEFTHIHHNTVHGFNAHIKANGTDTGPMGERVWPDDVVVEYNELYNPAPRNTGNPVTFIDVVGGRRWRVRANYIHDFAKGGGNNISYAAFLKGNSRDGIFERNLVVCEMLHSGQIRLGLSFGGGGSAPDNICEDGTCDPEHQNGIMRNNIIAHCPADVGIYVNEGANSRIYNNTLYNTTGIDMRFVSTTGEVRNNLLNGQIRNRDGATANFASNLEMVSVADFQAWFTDPDALDFSLVDGSMFVDQGETLAEVIDDYCTNIRDDGSHDLGALEFDGDGTCNTSVPFEGSDSGGDTDGTTDGGTTDGGTTDGGTTDGGTTDGGTTGGGTTGGETTGDSTGGNDDIDGTTAAADDSVDGGGCSCSSGGSQQGAGGALALLALLGLGLGRRRRR